MTGLDNRCRAARSQLRIVEKQDHIVIQRTLISLRSQRVVALLLYDLRGDRTLAVQRVGRHDGALER